MNSKSRDNIIVKFTIFDENLGGGGKKMPSGQAVITISAQSFTSVDSIGVGLYIGTKTMHTM